MPCQNPAEILTSFLKSPRYKLHSTSIKKYFAHQTLWCQASTQRENEHRFPFLSIFSVWCKSDLLKNWLCIVFPGGSEELPLDLSSNKKKLTKYLFQQWPYISQPGNLVMHRENISVVNHDKGWEYCQCCRALGSEPLSWLYSDVVIDLIYSEMITGDTPYII